MYFHHFHSQTGKTVNPEIYFWNVVALQEKSQSSMGKLNQRTMNINKFVVLQKTSSHILIFAVIKVKEFVTALVQ